MEVIMKNVPGKEGRIRTGLMVIFVLTMCILTLSACSASSGKSSVRTLIIPKFEIGRMSGDFPGEAQLFYEAYCQGCEEIEIPHMPSTGHFYFNDENGVGILVTGSGKTAAGLSLMAVLSSEQFDFSDAAIVSVGCAGGSAAETSLGDVILVTAVCDYDLGHHVDTHERKQSNSHIMWFPDDSYADYEFKLLNEDLCEKAYEMIRDCPLQTTEQARSVMKKILRPAMKKRFFRQSGKEPLFPEIITGKAYTAM